MPGSLSTDEAWGAAARDWAEFQESMKRPLFEEVFRRTAVGAGSTVLDVGCGTGLFCLMAAERGAQVSGLDASNGQLAFARERLPNGDFRHGYMEELPFESGMFDLVTCCTALQYAMDPVQALREMKRVARSGATIGILGNSKHGAGAREPYQEALAAFRQPNPPDAPPMIISRQPGELEASMAQLDLTIYADEEIACNHTYPDLEAALRGILSGAPAVRSIRAVGEAPVRAALSAALLVVPDANRTADGGFYFPKQIRYVLARTP